MVPPRIIDVLRGAHRQRGVDELVVAAHKVRPLAVLGHADGARTQLVDGAVRGVGLALEDRGVGVVCLLDLAYDDGLQLAARRLKVQVCLEKVSLTTRTLRISLFCDKTHLVQIGLLVNLPLNLPVNRQPHQIRILLPRGKRRVHLGLPQHVLQRIHGLPRPVHLLVHRVFEVARQVADLLDLLVEVTPQPRECQNDVGLDLLGAGRVLAGGAVMAADDVDCVVEAALGGEEGGMVGEVVGGGGDAVCGLCAGFVMGLDFFEEGYEVLEELSPRCRVLVSAVFAGGGRTYDVLWNLVASASVGFPPVGTGQ